MTLVIKSECIDVKDGECAKVCPVDCIYEGGRMFYIQPFECVECGLCESVCPVDAIRYDDEVEEKDAEFVRINREYFEDSVTGLGEAGGWSKATTTEIDHPLVAAMPHNITALETDKSKEP
ncbi:MAG: ferredoxin family protein [Hoeflea sp.]|uniref:4Fe-4S dicluster domain-containing protein n=1 Tax=Hoeflea sp. TaxID=1940281 RepID=UPI003299921B